MTLLKTEASVKDQEITGLRHEVERLKLEIARLELVEKTDKADIAGASGHQSQDYHRRRPGRSSSNMASEKEMSKGHRTSNLPIKSAIKSPQCPRTYQTNWG